MKKSFMLLAVAMLAFAGSAMAQNSASTNGVASAWGIRPLKFDNTCPGVLSFGNVIGSANGGTVSISTSGTVTYNTASNLKPGTQTGTTSAACFCATGEGGFAINILNTNGQVVPINLTPTQTPGAGQTNTLNVTLTAPSVSSAFLGGSGAGWLHDGDNDSDPSDVTSEDDGHASWCVGGTLTIVAGLTPLPGTYTGTWNETISYQ